MPLSPESWSVLRFCSTSSHWVKSDSCLPPPAVWFQLMPTAAAEAFGFSVHVALSSPPHIFSALYFTLLSLSFCPLTDFSVSCWNHSQTQVNNLKGAFLAVHRSKTFVCFSWAFVRGEKGHPSSAFAGYHHGKVNLGEAIVAYFSSTRNFTKRASHCMARMRLLLNDLVRKSAVWKLLRGGLSFTISQRHPPPLFFSLGEEPAFCSAFIYQEL